MDETRTAPHSAATRPQEALPDDAFELVGAGWREHRPALRRPGWRQRLARLPLLPLCLLLLLVLGCLCAPWLANHDPAEFYLADRNTPPGSRFFFGTDSLGRDIYSIIWFGGRASLLIGLLSAAVITVLGVAYGCLSGIAPARTDALLMRLVELVQSIPVLLVLLLAVSLLGPQNALSIALLIGVTGWFALARIVRGEVRPLDVMECCGRYAINICSVGIDARIGTEVHQYHDSYVLSAVANLFKGIAQPLTVRGCGMEYSGGTSLICACNGRFYGGGFNPIPDSMPDNGKLEFLVVRDVSRLTFIRLVGKYAKGRYRELANLITHLEGDHLEIDSETELVVNVDGEALWSKHVNFDLIPGGVNFLVPANMAFFHPETAGGHETREFVHT